MARNKAFISFLSAWVILFVVGWAQAFPLSLFDFMAKDAKYFTRMLNEMVDESFDIDEESYVGGNRRVDSLSKDERCALPLRRGHCRALIPRFRYAFYSIHYIVSGPKWLFFFNEKKFLQEKICFSPASKCYKRKLRVSVAASGNGKNVLQMQINKNDNTNPKIIKLYLLLKIFPIHIYPPLAFFIYRFLLYEYQHEQHFFFALYCCFWFACFVSFARSMRHACSTHFHLFDLKIIFLWLYLYAFIR